MRIKGTGRKAVEAMVATSETLADYVRLYPDAKRRAVEIVTGVAGDYAEMGMELVIEIAEDAAARVERLGRMFGLTASEALLALHIADGGSTADYAAARRITRNTVRNQLQAVFDKTGARRQTELVRLLADY
ncbi:helix-turn-helix transcriptional regulator [Sphingopyxis sp. PET50]|uniref:helix-turn-helix transcriptional regulator n=1 Tax=Sphingopyxis sp. PET50 TaxID=2976533 RepID=UPI0021AF0F65|nr:helix-turn-helix transcriptional regulator [Sphingopyxis sp. PET50]